MRIADAPSQLERRPRAAAIGTFDGVHRGHRSVLRTAVESGLEPTVITLDPHPRIVLGNRVELLTTLERRLELLAEAGIADTLVAAFTPEFMRLTPEEFVDRYIRSLGVEAVAVGADFRFGTKRSGSVETLRELGLTVLDVEEVEGVSSTAIRDAVRAGLLAEAAAMLGRPFELDGTVVSGDQRGGTLGYPTANIAMDAQLVSPRSGIYAGEALGHRAAVSIGTNPHYGGTERRIEPFLLDFEGDLYGKRLVVELWERLRDEAVFDSEEALIEQIAKDVEATRAAVRPV
jgi:riboflavin kinase/FMN adenylyltransferase